MSSDEEVQVVEEKEALSSKSLEVMEEEENLDGEFESLDAMDGESAEDDMVVVVESSDLPEMEDADEEESFDAIAAAEESYDALSIDEVLDMEEELLPEEPSYEGDIPDIEEFDGEEVLEEGAEIMEETLEDVLDQVDEIVEETRTESMEDEMEEEGEEDVTVSSEDTVVGELEVTELNEADEEPVLVREDEENNVLGVEDGIGQQMFSKLFGH